MAEEINQWCPGHPPNVTTLVLAHPALNPPGISYQTLPSSFKCSKYGSMNVHLLHLPSLYHMALDCMPYSPIAIPPFLSLQGQERPVSLQKPLKQACHFKSVLFLFLQIPNRPFPYFQHLLISCQSSTGMSSPTPPLSPTLLFETFNGSQDTLVSLGMSMLFSLPKLQPICSLQCSLVPSLLPLPKFITTSITKGDTTFPTPISNVKFLQSLWRNCPSTPHML